MEKEEGEHLGQGLTSLWLPVPVDAHPPTGTPSPGDAQGPPADSWGGGRLCAVLGAAAAPGLRHTGLASASCNPARCLRAPAMPPSRALGFLWEREAVLCPGFLSRGT